MNTQKNSSLEAMPTQNNTRTPLLIWGAPGTGKTSAAAALAVGLGLPFYSFSAAEEDPADTCGPIGEAADGTSTRKIPQWYAAACEKPYVILIDELTAAAPEQQAAVLRICDDRRTMAGHTLHSRTLVIAAANPPECAAGAARELSAPVLTRFRHKRITEKHALDFMAGGPGFVIAWPTAPALPGMIRIVAEYLKRNPQAAMATAEEIARAVETQTPYPCPRSWTRAAAEEGDVTLWGEYTGETAAAGFIQWFNQMDLPDPVEIVAGRCMTIPPRGDAVMATAAAIAGVLGHKPSAAALECSMKWFSAAADAGQAANALQSVRTVIAAVGVAAVSRHAEALKRYGGLVAMATPAA
jgi:hypothetical protein